MLRVDGVRGSRGGWKRRLALGGAALYVHRGTARCRHSCSGRPLYQCGRWCLGGCLGGCRCCVLLWLSQRWGQPKRDLVAGVRAGVLPSGGVREGSVRVPSRGFVVRLSLVRLRASFPVSRAGVVVQLVRVDPDTAPLNYYHIRRRTPQFRRNDCGIRHGDQGSCRAAAASAATPQRSGRAAST